MTPGQIVKVRRAGGQWLEAEVLLASDNERSLALAVDEGLPLPFAIYPEIGCQVLMLMKHDSGYCELGQVRYWEVEPTETIKRDGKAEAFKRHTQAFRE